MKIDAFLRPPPRWSWLTFGLVINVLLGLVSLFLAHGHYGRSRALAAQVENVQASRKPVVATVPTPADLEMKKRWQAIASEAAFSWYAVFRALEDSNSSNIELLEFFPDKGARRVVLRGEARDQSSLTTYVGALSAQAVFRELFLAHHKTVRKNDMDIVVFEVRATIAG